VPRVAGTRGARCALAAWRGYPRFRVKLAQIPHALLAAHVGTIMGVETNAMQFYPTASQAEEAVHPGLYRRRKGMLDLSSIHGPGFGYRLAEIRRELPPAAVECGT